MSENSGYHIPVPSDRQMRATDIFSFNGGINRLKSDYEKEFYEIISAIEENYADEVFTKKTEEDNKDKRKLLASPAVMNHNILMEQLKNNYGWEVNHSPNNGQSEVEKAGKTEPYKSDDTGCKLDISPNNSWGEKTIDGLKNRMGVEVQFGKYAFLPYDILAKFGHFKLADRIDIGVEVVANHNLKSYMSNGPGYYEQIQSEVKSLSDNYISPEYQLPIIGIGIGFERDKINLEKLEDEVNYFEQTNIDDWS